MSVLTTVRVPSSGPPLQTVIPAELGRGVVLRMVESASSAQVTLTTTDPAPLPLAPVVQLPEADPAKLYKAWVRGVAQTSSSATGNFDLEASKDNATWTRIARHQRLVQANYDALYVRFPMGVVPGGVALAQGDTLYVRCVGSNSTGAAINVRGDTDPGQITLVLQEVQP